jgi:glutamyl-tRNA synthetase
MAEAAEIFFKPPDEFDPDAAKKFLAPELGEIISDMIILIKAIPHFNKEGIERIFKEIQAKYNIKLVKLAQAVRVSLTGKTVSPGIYEVMEILGKDEVVNRLKRAVDFIGKGKENN